MKFYELAIGQPRFADKSIKAIATGAIRPPQKGEWFISEAIPEAYLATNDMTTSYDIARLVKVREVSEYRIDEFL